MCQLVPLILLGSRPGARSDPALSAFFTAILRQSLLQEWPSSFFQLGNEQWVRPHTLWLSANIAQVHTQVHTAHKRYPGKRISSEGPMYHSSVQIE